MKRVASILLVIVMFLGVASAYASTRVDSSRFRLEYNETIQDYAMQRFKEVREYYNKSGGLSREDMEFAYSYLKLYLAAKRTVEFETVYPEETDRILSGIDFDIEIEEKIDNEWQKLLSREIGFDEFIKAIMAISKYVIKE